MNRDILIIEDDERFRRSLILLLKEDGYTLHEASTVEGGMDKIYSFPEIKVVILDLSLGSEAGTDFLKRIEQEASRFRVTVLTAREDLLAAEVAEKYSVFNYLPKGRKPFRQSIRFSIDQSFKDLEREHLNKKLRKLLEIQEKINASEESSANDELNANAKLREILRSICEAVLDIVGGYTCHIRLLDIRKGDYSLAAFASSSLELSESMQKTFSKPKKAGEPFSGLVIKLKEKGPKTFDDLQTDPDFRAFKEETLRSKGVTQEVREYFDTAQSAYIAPVFTNVTGKVVSAVLNISSKSKSFFSEEKCEAISEFVTQASLAITRDLLYNKRIELHQDYSRISEMLGKVTSKLTDLGGMAEIYNVVTAEISKIVNAEVVSILLFNERACLLENVAELRGDKRIKGFEEKYRPGQSLAGSVYSEGKTIRIPNPQAGIDINPTEDKRYDTEHKEIYLKNIPSERLEHYLAVPISIGNRKLGVLRAINKKSEYYEGKSSKSNMWCLLESGFSKDCENVLEITASYLAVAIRNAQLFSRLNRQVNMLETLNSVGRIINSERDLNELLKLTIEKTAQVMRAEICMLFLKDDDEGNIILKECYGMPMIEGAFYKLGKGLTGQVALDGKSQLIKETDENEGKYDAQIEEFLRQKHGKDKAIESLMVVPIIAKSEILGSLKVINKVGDHHQYDGKALKVFETFASYVGIAIENAKVYDLTNQKLAIAERNAALSTVVRAVAHEINNASGLIPNNVQGIKSELAKLDKELATTSLEAFHNINANILEMLETIEDSARQAVDFANEIAGFRLGEGKVADINEVIRKAIKQIKPDLRRYPNFRNISIENNLSEELLFCEIFEGSFIQIIRNIIINAYQAMEKCEKGALKVITHKDSYRWKAVVRLSDNGPGIKHKYIYRIFDPEFTTKPKGNGLGLWLVKNHLEQMGGTIDVESQVNQGAIFIVEIPLASEEKGHEQ